jgi:hypothetical protein
MFRPLGGEGRQKMWLGHREGLSCLTLGGHSLHLRVSVEGKEASVLIYKC